MTLLIAGTDTEVGKTVLTTAFIAYWQTHRNLADLGVMKLMQAGEGDSELYQKLFDLQQPPETLVPLYFQTPVAPPIAAAKEGVEIDLGKVWQALTQLQQTRKTVIVEALGGLGSPVTPELTVADLARDWRLETVLVVPVRLGAIAQTVANIALARQMRVSLQGIVLNCVTPEAESRVADWTPPELIQSLTQTPVLGIMPYLAATQDVAKLAQIAANLDLWGRLGSRSWAVGSRQSAIGKKLEL
ncbi:MAG: dethiobiotin synthase [Jaaginema sp. PMC 1079.18]|nr:dethiobiotin synthase [Jaaginema sp. PMC 1080.18]MEC4850066.1 dethiobiotin synthase [Jaaginema sp. PMC 1079.18]MEC4864631.1 dethiobiotin synthase [Jaaginema sp. PMC 1078.18]